MTSVLKKSRGAKGKSTGMQEDIPSREMPVCSPEDTQNLIQYIDENVIGKDSSFCGPYGRRKVVYCDYSGSGRSLRFLEECVTRLVLPSHVTQCTAVTHSSLQCSLFRGEARAAVRVCVGASEGDVPLVGVSPARLVRSLRPEPAVLFVSSRETERQITPFRECHAEVIKIPETKEGFIDLNNLELRLQEYSGTGKRMIGFFSAASKLTGVLADDVATTLLLHQYGAWAFWDYTLAAASVAIDMNPSFPGVEDHMVSKDALFFNCEKMVGGVQAPYVAVVKKTVFKNTPLDSDDIENIIEKFEESGVTEAARATLVLQLRDAVGLQNIAKKQDEITRQVLAHIKNIPELILLGNENVTSRRLPIFSIMVKHPRGTFLHHNFVCAVLNDVFGIQARGGLSSNLSYGQDILGIDAQLLQEYEQILNPDRSKSNEPDYWQEHLRPGFCRISLPYFMSESELGFILEALKMVAQEGWRILPQYIVDTKTGQWRHHSNAVYRDRKSLLSVRFTNGKMTYNQRKISGLGIFPQTYTECLQTARNLFNKARKLAMKTPIEQELSFHPKKDYLRWFMLPKEAHDLLLGKSSGVKHIVPFDPSGITVPRKGYSLSSRSDDACSPVFGSSPRHYSLSAIDDCHIMRFKQKQKFYSRESSLSEKNEKEQQNPPVKFALGQSVSPTRLQSIVQSSGIPMRSRCFSLGSDSPPPALSPQTRVNLGLSESPLKFEKSSNSICHCGSQTDLQSLDDPMISPGRFTYSNTSTSDCSQVGRLSPTVSITSHTSEDFQTYLKEMTKEIATELKSEIREVISQVDDILDNSEMMESNVSVNSTSSQSDKSEKNSVSVSDVAEYLMGISREMASDLKHEIREMVNKVDEMLPESSSRRSSPPDALRHRVGSGPELGLDLSKPTLKKSTTSPVLPALACDDFNSLKSSMSSILGTPHDVSGPNSMCFNSSDTSTPETIIQVVSTASDSPSMPKSMSSNKLSDDECCSDMCRGYYNKKNWSQNPSVSSQDSGINMSFPETDSYHDMVKWRTCSEGGGKGRRARVCQRPEKSEVPDIIEGVPACAHQHAQLACRLPCQLPCQHAELARTRTERVSDSELLIQSRQTSRLCTKSSVESAPGGFVTSDCHSRQRLSQESDDFRYREGAGAGRGYQDGSDSEESDGSLTDAAAEPDSEWQPPPGKIWRPALDALEEYGMVGSGARVLACVSGSGASIALLHVLRHYQMHARTQGTHFTIGAIFVNDGEYDVDPLHLMAYCRTLGVKFIYQDKADGEHALREESCNAWSRWGSRVVRRRVYAAARQFGYGVAAVAHTLDRAAAATLAAALGSGRLASLRPHVAVREQKVRVIRPLVYVRARHLQQWADAAMLPHFRRLRPPSPHCIEQAAGAGGRDPLSVARALLAQAEGVCPSMYDSLRRALHPLISDRSGEDLKEHRHRKKSVIQMKNGAPVYDSEDGTDEEPVP